MNKYLDIISLLSSDFYKSNERISWHINHDEYNKFNKDVFDLLEKIKFKEKENDIFQLAKPSIYRTLSEYLSHVYDYVVLC